MRPAYQNRRPHLLSLLTKEQRLMFRLLWMKPLAGRRGREAEIVDERIIQLAKSYEQLTNEQWNSFQRFSLHQGLSSEVWRLLNHYNLAAHVPDEIRNRFAETHRNDVARSMALKSQLVKALRQVCNSGIRIVALKGSTLAHTLYANPACRTMRDIDLLVRKEDVEATVASLEEIGYHTVPMPAHLDARIEGHVLLIAPGTGAKIELHFFPGRNFFPALEQDNNGAFWDRIRPMSSPAQAGISGFSAVDNPIERPLDPADSEHQPIRPVISSSTTSISSSRPMSSQPLVSSPRPMSSPAQAGISRFSAVDNPSEQPLDPADSEHQPRHPVISSSHPQSSSAHMSSPAKAGISGFSSVDNSNEQPPCELSPEDALLYLCTHVSGHGYQVYCIRGLYDIALLLNRHADTLDWTRIVHFAQKHHLEHPVALPLLLAKILYRAPLDDIIPSRLTVRSMRQRALGIALKLTLASDHDYKRIPPPGREMLWNHSYTNLSSLKKYVTSW